MTLPPRIVLGPQRHHPILREAISSLPGRAQGPIAAITAGWEERELEDGELREHLGPDPGHTVVNLELFGRAEDVFRRDPELFQAMRDRHDRMRRLQEVYRLRLDHALDAARELLARRNAGGDPHGVLEPEIASAIEAVRTLDAHHLERLREVHADFEATAHPDEREAVQHHRRELESIVGDSGVVCVAGGHVAILLNRLRLFRLDQLLGNKAVVAWSAGAMALSPRVIVFHDSPPQGPGNAEVLELGLDVMPDLVPLPHADKRLRLEDRPRVELFAQRFGTDLCAVLIEGKRLDLASTGWKASGDDAESTRRLAGDGNLVRLT